MTDIMEGISPLPWVKDEGQSYEDQVTDNNGRMVCPALPADTDFIVHACNAYPSHVAAIAELVEALAHAQDSIHVAYCGHTTPGAEHINCIGQCLNLQLLIAKHKGAS